MRHSQRDYCVKRHVYFGPIVLADHQFTEAWFIFQIHMVLVFDNYLKLFLFTFHILVLAMLFMC